MAADYIGSAIKHAHSEDEAFKCLASKQGKWDKRAGTIIDKNRNLIKILDINEI